MMANGMLGNTPSQENLNSLTPFRRRSMISPTNSQTRCKGRRGWTKLVEVYVKGTRNEQDGSKGGPFDRQFKLVQTPYTAMTQTGKIMAHFGYSGVAFKEEKTDIYFNNIRVVKGGLANNKDREATAALKAKDIRYRRFPRGSYLQSAHLRPHRRVYPHKREYRT